MEADATQHATTRREIASFLVVLSLVILILMGNIVQSWFLLKDDWAAVGITADVHLPATLQSFEDSFDRFTDYGITTEIEIGRFRPVYWLIYTIEAHLYYPNASLWYGVRLAQALFACLLIHLILRRLGVPWIGTTVAATTFAVSSYPLWVDIPIAESDGMLFLLIGLWSLTRGTVTKHIHWDIAGIIALTLAVWCKETFLFVVPAVFLYRLTLEYSLSDDRSLWQIVMTKRGIIIGAGIIFFLQGLLVIFAYLADGYGQQVVIGQNPAASVNRYSPLYWVETLILNRLIFQYFIPLVGVIPLVWHRWKVQRHRLILVMAAFIIILWSVPQFLIYAGSGMSGHYLYPFSLVIVALYAFGITGMMQHTPRILAWGIIALFFIAAAYVIPTRLNLMNRQIALTDAYEQFIETTKEALAASDTQTMLLVTEPFYTHPLSVSFFVGENLETQPTIYWMTRKAGRFTDEEIAASEILIADLLPLYTSDLSDTIEVVGTFYGNEVDAPIGFDGTWTRHDIQVTYPIIRYSVRQFQFETTEQSAWLQVFERTTE